MSRQVTFLARCASSLKPMRAALHSAFGKFQMANLGASHLSM